MRNSRVLRVLLFWQSRLFWLWIRDFHCFAKSTSGKPHLPTVTSWLHWTLHDFATAICTHHCPSTAVAWWHLILVTSSLARHRNWTNWIYSQRNGFLSFLLFPASKCLQWLFCTLAQAASAFASSPSSLARFTIAMSPTLRTAVTSMTAALKSNKNVLIASSLLAPKNKLDSWWKAILNSVGMYDLQKLPYSFALHAAKLPCSSSFSSKRLEWVAASRTSKESSWATCFRAKYVDLSSEQEPSPLDCLLSKLLKPRGECPKIRKYQKQVKGINQSSPSDSRMASPPLMCSIASCPKQRLLW